MGSLVCDTGSTTALLCTQNPLSNGVISPQRSDAPRGCSHYTPEANPVQMTVTHAVGALCFFLRKCESRHPRQTPEPGCWAVLGLAAAQLRRRID